MQNKMQVHVQTTPAGLANMLESLNLPKIRIDKHLNNFSGEKRRNYVSKIQQDNFNVLTF